MRLANVDPTTLLIGIGAEVKRRRRALGFTQVTLATLVGIHPNVIGRLERGTYNPSVTVLYGIAAALHASLADLTKRRRGN
jgi:transcriptional regulator with XRE-family HTH domain